MITTDVISWSGFGILITLVDSSNSSFFSGKIRVTSSDNHDETLSYLTGFLGWRAVYKALEGLAELEKDGFQVAIDQPSVDALAGIDDPALTFTITTGMSLPFRKMREIVKNSIAEDIQ